MDLPARTESDTFRTVAEAFADLGEHIEAVSPEQTPEAVAEVAVAHLRGAEWASLTVLRRKRFATAAATHDVARSADQLQYELGSGPCVDAILEDAVFQPDDLVHDERWPEFGRQVAQRYGVRSMLAFRLPMDDDEVTAGLNLYAGRAHAFDHEDVDLGLLLAAHASLALAAALNKERAENLQQALVSNRDIGVAIGVLMSQHKLTRQQAFDLLRVASQHSNRKLHEVALDVAETGTLELPRRPRRASPPPG